MSLEDTVFPFICQEHILNTEKLDSLSKIDSAKALRTQLRLQEGKYLDVMLSSWKESSSCLHYQKIIPSWKSSVRTPGTQSSSILRKKIGMESMLMLQIKAVIQQRKIGGLNNNHYSCYLFSKECSQLTDTDQSNMLYLCNSTEISYY